MPAISVITASQKSPFGEQARGVRPRSLRRAMRTKSRGTKVATRHGHSQEAGIRELFSRSDDKVVFGQVIRTGSNKAVPVTRYEKPERFKIPVGKRTSVKPTTGKEAFLSYQVSDFSGQETVRDLQRWLRTLRSAQELANSEYLAPEPQDIGQKRPSIEPHDDVETVLRKLENGLFEHVASRIRYLEQEIDEEEGEEPIALDSLRRFAQFMLENRSIASPSTWIDHRGFLGLEWRIPYQEHPGEFAEADPKHWGRGDGILAMVFLPNGLIRFSGTSGPLGQGIDRLKVSGTYTPSDTLEAVQPFLSRLDI